MPKPVKAIRVFPDIDEFARRHRAGTEAEFAANQQLVDEINKQDHKFQAWIVSKTRQTPKRLEYLIIVQPGPDGERKIPQQGEPARLRVVLDDKSFTRFWDARRIESPLAFMNINTQSTEKLAAYQVTTHIADAYEGVQPLIDTPATSRNPSDVCAADNRSADDHSDGASTSGDSGIGDCNPDLNSEREAGIITMTDDNSVQVNFLLTASEATKNAELDALDQFCGRHKGNVSERQQKAFEYFVLLRNPGFFVDLHEQIPHLTSAMNDPSWPASPLGQKFALLNPQQKDAYLHGFRKLHCGICILPGGPGAGKTHFNLFTIAMAQSQPLPRPVKVNGRLENSCPKILFIVDMNCPELGMKKSIIRMKGWGAEVKASDRLNAVEDPGSEEMQVDFTNQFLRTTGLMSLGPRSGRRSCEAPSLDEAAWHRYDEFKHTKYEELTQYLEGELWESSDIVPLRLRRLIYHLYRDTLAAADFIATTPVAASNHFRGMFKPDLVYFDESPHARELTNLIAVANFDPIAWIFCGDYRQTVPYVGSTGLDSNNIYRDQMQVSMMERAAVANVISHELLMNHRSFGGLHELASIMWYDGRMVSGNEGRIHPELAYVQQYLAALTEQPCDVPRAVVHLNNCGPERRDGTSAHNPSHAGFVMTQVCALLNDPQFKGDILIMSPYKKAFNEYRNEIKKLPQWAQQRVEARTVDVAQGHEADIVYFDLVKERSTNFLDDPNRLCVALTRARVGEIIMMHPNMPRSVTFKKNSRNLRPICELCNLAGQVVHLDYDPETIRALPTSRTAAFEDRSTAINVAGASPSALSAFDVSVPHEPDNSQASEACGDQLPTNNEDQPASAQSVAGDVTNLAHEITQDAPTNEAGSPALSALSSVVDSEPAGEVAPIDDGDLWWSLVMNRSAHVAPAEKEDKTVEVQPPIENTERSLDDDSTRVVTDNKQEVATVVPSTATDAPTAHDITEEVLNAKTPAPPDIAVSAFPCSIDSKTTPDLAPIDDGQLWSLVMNGPSHVALAEDKGSIVVVHLPVENANTSFGNDSAHIVTTNQEEIDAVASAPSADTVTRLADDISEKVVAEDSPIPVVLAIPCAAVNEPTRDSATIDDGELWWSLAMSNVARLVPAAKEVNGVEDQPPDEIAVTILADAATEEVVNGQTTPISDPPVACNVDGKDAHQVAPIDDGDLWWGLAMNGTAQLVNPEKSVVVPQSTATDVPSSAIHDSSAEIVTTIQEAGPASTASSAADNPAGLIKDICENITVEEKPAPDFEGQSTPVAPETVSPIVEKMATTVDRETTAPLVQEAATSHVEKMITAVATETTVPETIATVVEETATSTIPAISWAAEKTSTQELPTIDDGDLWWKMAMNEPARLVAASKKESSVVAQSMPTNAPLDNNISKKLVLDDLRKEIVEEVRRAVEEELRKKIDDEVRKKVEEEMRKLVEECRVGTGLALLTGMFARGNAEALMS